MVSSKRVDEDLIAGETSPPLIADPIRPAFCAGGRPQAER
jgi:hypothetical protein